MTGRNRLLVWRTQWLPRSNTFVRDQIRAYERWHALSFGLVRLQDPLVEPDGHVFRDGRIAQLAQRRLSVSTQQALAARSAKKLAPRLLHVHFGTDAVFARGVADRLAIPLVVTFHGYDVTALSGREAYVPQLTDLLDRADLLVAVSGHIEQTLYDLGADRAKVMRHYTGVPISAGAPPGTDRSGVLFVGRLVEKKGVADLITAYARLPASVRSQHPLTIVGDGPLESALRSLDRELTAGAVFAGSLTSDEVSVRFDHCAVACVPSKRAANGDTEGLPTVILEAAAHGLPVVASIHAGNAEAVRHGDTGLLFAEGDVPALVDHLSELLGDERLRSAMGAAGRRLIERDFDINKQVLKLEQAYDRLI